MTLIQSLPEVARWVEVNYAPPHPLITNSVRLNDDIFASVSQERGGGSTHKQQGCEENEVGLSRQPNQDTPEVRAAHSSHTFGWIQ